MDQAVAAGRQDPKQWPLIGEARVIGVINAAGLLLEDGREVAMVGLEPEPPIDPSHAHGAPNPAVIALTDMVLNRPIRLRGAGAPDRYGRVQAQVFDGDDTWIQGQMIERGLTRVLPFPDGRLVTAALLKLEAKARAEQLGLWAPGSHGAQDPVTAATAFGRFVVVEGRPIHVGHGRSGYYLDFAARGDHGLALKITTVLARSLVARGGDPADLLGQNIRARGIVIDDHGPKIMILQREQIEVIGAEK
jgi:hypothetical protein